MKGFGSIINLMEKEKLLVLMGVFMLVIIKMVTCMAMGSTSGAMDLYIRANSLIITSMDTVNTSGQMVENVLVTGITIPYMGMRK